MSSPSPRRAGFSVVEVVLALAVVSFSLMAILGLFSVGIRSVGESESRLQAANLASALLSQRIAQPGAALPNFPLPAIVVSELKSDAASAPSTSALVDSGGATAPGAASARYRVTSQAWRDTTFSATGDLVRVHVQVSWPAGAAQPPNHFDLLASFHSE